MLRSLPVLAVVAFACASAQAASSVRLPAGTCSADDTIFFDAFDGAIAVPSDPSQGSGGIVPASGDVAGSASAAGYGTFDYYLHLPVGYDPSRGWPLLVALHGAGSPTTHAGAVAQAQATRTAWKDLADAAGLVVLAPVSSGASGGWLPGHDYAGIRAELDAVALAYNIDRSRVYLWGFSAGGHVAWDIVFNGAAYGTGFDADALAGMAVSAGVMEAVACTAPGGGCDALVAAQSRRMPFDIHVGDADPLQPYARQDRDRLLAHGWALGGTLGYHEFAGGHGYAAAQLGEAWAQICRYAKGP